MKRYVVEKEGLGCLNLIIWDFLFTVIFIYFLFKYYVESIHPVVGLLLGITSAIVLVLLMDKHIVGPIIHTILGGAWGLFFYSIANGFFKWSTSDKIWNAFFIIVFCLIGISLHFASHKDMNDDQEIEFTATSKRTKEDYYEHYQQYEQQEQKEEYDHSKKSAGEFNPFAGCSTKEQVKTRYKQLMKSFHPDLGMGDEETAKLLNNEYERLMKQYN